MAPPTDPPPAAAPPAAAPPAAPPTVRRPSAATAALTLGAVALVAAGVAWAGRASVRRAAVPAAPPGVAAGPQASPASGLPPETQALLDGGNAAFRSGQYEAALGHYRAAAARTPGHAAPWIGVQMAARKLGRTALADSAMAAVQQRTDAPGAGDDGAMRRAHDSARVGAPAPRRAHP